MSHTELYESGLNRLLINPTGPVSKYIDRKAGEIKNLAFANIQALTVKRTGDLLGSMKTIPFDTAEGHHVAVGADAIHDHGKSGPFPYARALETGIDPLSGKPMHYVNGPFAYMVPAVKQAGFKPRSL